MLCVKAKHASPTVFSFSKTVLQSIFSFSCMCALLVTCRQYSRRFRRYPAIQSLMFGIIYGATGEPKRLLLRDVSYWKESHMNFPEGGTLYHADFFEQLIHVALKAGLWDGWRI